MPAFPYRRNRVRSAVNEPLERWEPPVFDEARNVVRGMVIGLAAGVALWAVAITVSSLAFRWLT